MSAFDERHDAPLFMAMSDDDEALVSSVEKAKETLPHFKTAFSKPRYKAAYFMVKSRFVNRDEAGEEAILWQAHFAGQYDAQETTHIWLAVNDVLGELLFCSTFESPENSIGLHERASFVLQDGNVEDWLINDGGRLYGGFSIRLMRYAVAEKDRDSFDRYAGISEYMDSMP
jgi:uncharacterized protein YegJ (DUF2314 family)